MRWVYLATFALWAACGAAAAQDNVAEEKAHRAALLAQLPHDAAQRVFGLEVDAGARATRGDRRL